MSASFDVILIGSGPSASRIADKCAAADRQVAVIDSRPIGGTCALRGCNPKKVLVRAAELRDWARRSEGELVTSPEMSIDWQQLMKFKRTFTDPVTPKTKKSYAEKGIAVFEGAARFVSPEAVEVGGQRLVAEHFVIATGARPRDLDIPGSQWITTSDTFLETNSLPERIVFLGGGYISCEFAQVAHQAGAKVTILEVNDRILGGFERDLVSHLTDEMRQSGIDVMVNHEVQEIRQSSSDGFTVVTKSGDESPTFAADMVVHGAGRVPAIDGLNLEAGEVEFTDAGIRVDDSLRSQSNPRVFAAGDVVDCKQPKLTPVANQHGRIIAQNILENVAHTPEYGAVPRVVFTLPSLASIGLTEDECKEQSLDVDVRKRDMTDWTSNRKVGGPPAAYKILVENTTDRFVGAHLLGPSASEVINLFALAMKCDLTATDVKSALFAFPTFTSDVRQML